MLVLWQRRTMMLRIALLAALLTTATMVLLLVGVGTAGAVGEEESGIDCFKNGDCSLMFCSHPGASRHQDGSLLDGNPVDGDDGDEISVHPTEGDYTQSIATGGVLAKPRLGRVHRLEASHRGTR